MPLDSRHRQIIKHSKRQQTVFFNAVIPVVTQYTMSTALSFLFNRPPPKPMGTRVPNIIRGCRDFLFFIPTKPTLLFNFRESLVVFMQLNIRLTKK